jgi:uncharacterized protein
VFTREPIFEGEVVAIWGGVVMTSADIEAGAAKPHSIAEIGENILLASLPKDEDSIADFMNHSCDPNVWFLDEVTLVARHDISPDEEITVDYALWGSQPSWQECLCGADLCRGLVSEDDWRRVDLQARYEGHWSPYIEARIRTLASPE